jgi:lysophospholipase
VAEILTRRGFVVLIHDWRGHGLSVRVGPDTRGHALGWRDFVTDYAALLAAFEARLPKPWLALGHSMGGCLTLLAMAEGESRFAGAILSAPMLGLQTGPAPPAVARLLAGGLTQVGFGAGLAAHEGPAPEPFASNVLTHDEARYHRNLDQVATWPQLQVGPPTWGWLAFAFAATDRLARGAGTATISAPLTVVAAGEERLVDNVAAQRTAARFAAARFVTVAGAYHELLQETDAIQARFWAEFDALAVRAGA